MKKAYITALIALTLSLSGCQMNSGKGAIPMDVRVMTFNIRNGSAEDGENHWINRKEKVSNVIDQYSPDVLGLQEALRFQLDEIKKDLPEYGEIGTGRDGDLAGEYSAILYRKSRFHADESGTFWLSKTPSEPSTHWGNRYLRICTWIRLLDKDSGRSFYIYNTHLDHESQLSREKSTRLIVQFIQNRTHPDPCVLIGDFNAGEDNPAITYLQGKGIGDVSPIPFVDTYRMLHPDEEVVGTFNEFSGQSKGPKIDYIFVMPEARTIEAEIVRTNEGGRYPSDHYPVTARLVFE